jgi:hypothetical protein
MDTHLANHLDTSLDSHRHDWQPITGWRARYRCNGCGVIARKPRLVTHLYPWGPANPDATPKITPYVCTLKIGELRCGCLAVKKIGRKKWRCRAHLLAPAIHTMAAVLARPNWKDAALALLRELDECA